MLTTLAVELELGVDNKKSSGCRQNGSAHQWRPSGKETTEGPTTSLLSHVNGESEYEMGEGCGEGKEGLAWEVEKDQQRARAELNASASKRVGLW